MGRADTCRLLKHNNAVVSVTNGRGETPLHIAAQYGHVEVCAVLLHPTSSLKMDQLALTPIHHAVRNNHPEVVELLAKYVVVQSKVWWKVRPNHEMAISECSPLSGTG